MKTHLASLLAAAALALALAPGANLVAQTAPAPPLPDNLRAVLELFRSDVNRSKIRTLNETLQLTGPEADQFWPVYRQYEKELATVGDEKVALLREFTSRLRDGTLDDTATDRLTRRWLRNAQARLDLWTKYQKKMAKAVSPARALQFLQVEHQMALFIDLNIAAELPPLRAVTLPAGK